MIFHEKGVMFMSILRDIGFQSTKHNVSPYKYYDRIFNLLQQVCDEHNQFSQKFSGFLTLNLNKREVRHIFTEISSKLLIDENFYSNMSLYCSAALEFQIIADFEYRFADLGLSSRIKQDSSRVFKLYHYRVTKKEAGKVALNKCLNDLYGLRIIIEDFDYECPVFRQCFEYFKSKNPNSKFKLENSSKIDYKGIHIYMFGEKNIYFPWEMQIWNKNDEVTNKISHTEHKQEYTKWSEEYKNLKKIS